MRIDDIRIQKFRRLDDVLFSLDDETTFLCGPNNSGKTSVADVLQKFLNGDSFSPYDIPLSNIDELKTIGACWCLSKVGDPVDLAKEEERINRILPELTISFVYDKSSEIKKVQRFIPNFKKYDGHFAIGFRLVVKDIESLRSSFLKTHGIFETAKTDKKDTGESEILVDDLFHFLVLSDSLARFFKVKAHRVNPDNPSEIFDENDSFIKEARGLIKLDVVPADRGITGEEGTLSGSLSDFLTHRFSDVGDLNPEELSAYYDILKSNTLIGESMKTALGKPLEILKKQLHYPNLDNPGIDVSVRTDPGKIFTTSAEIRNSYLDGTETLPDSSNGLGYQNLVHITLRLWKYTDEWLNPEAKDGETGEIAPLHLVVIEEPEAHLHPQVEQLFAQRIHGILTEGISRLDLNDAQGIITTHSDALIRKVGLHKMRYFHRVAPSRPAAAASSEALPNPPTPKNRHVQIEIKDLSLFSRDKKEDAEFMQRYLISTSHELFFADAAIMVEGGGENAVLPHFIENRENSSLKEVFYSVVPIYGRHFGPIYEFLHFIGIPTLVITDADLSEKGADKILRKASAYRPGLLTSNEFLSSHLGNSADGETSKGIDEIVPKIGNKNVIDNTIIICQTSEGDYHPTTLEDAVIAHNKDLFKGLSADLTKGCGALLGVKEACGAGSTGEFERKVRDVIGKEGFKGDFAVQLLQTGILDSEKQADRVTAPFYIETGLRQLEKILERIKTDAN